MLKVKPYKWKEKDYMDHLEMMISQVKKERMDKIVKEKLSLVKESLDDISKNLEILNPPIK